MLNIRKFDTTHVGVDCVQPPNKIKGSMEMEPHATNQNSSKLVTSSVEACFCAIFIETKVENASNPNPHETTLRTD